MEETDTAPYRLLQLGAPDRRGVQRNERFGDLDGLVTHHPGANRHAHLVDGVPQRVENAARRSYGVIGGEIQELETLRTDEYRSLRADQVLLVKDFILEDSRVAPGGAGVRDVDVPSPMPGYVGRVDARNGVVDILDRPGGEVILRARHLEPIAVQVGDHVAYGQSLGTQDNKGLPARAGKHVHFEVDTRYYNLYERYVQDLSDGTLSIDPARRGQGRRTPAVDDDGVIRIGESADVVRLVQQRLEAAGFRDADGRPFEDGGVYRLSMQAAVIRYQQQNGLPPTGDLDPPTVRHLVPAVLPPRVNPEDSTRPRFPLEFRTSLGVGDAKHDPLLEQARECVHRLDASIGRASDSASERMACSLAVLAREHGFAHIDHVLLSVDGAGARAGQNVFVIQGEPGDPAKRMAHMTTNAALATPVEHSMERLRAMPEASSRTAATDDVQQEKGTRLIS